MYFRKRAPISTWKLQTFLENVPVLLVSQYVNIDDEIYHELGSMKNHEHLKTDHTQIREAALVPQFFLPSTPDPP